MPKRNPNHHERKRYHQVQKAYKKTGRSESSNKKATSRRRRANNRHQLSLALSCFNIEEYSFYNPIDLHNMYSWGSRHNCCLYFKTANSPWSHILNTPDITDDDVKRIPARLRHQWKDDRREEQNDIWNLRTSRSQQYNDFETIYRILCKILNTPKGNWLEQNWYRRPPTSKLREWMIDQYFWGYKSWQQNGTLEDITEDLQILGYWPYTTDKTRSIPEELYET